jgi:hypothetical protein
MPEGREIWWIDLKGSHCLGDLGVGRKALILMLDVFNHTLLLNSAPKSI